MGTGQTIARLGDHIVGLSLVEGDGVELSAQMSVEGVTIRNDVDGSVVLRTKNGGQTYSVCEVALHL